MDTVEMCKYYLLKTLRKRLIFEKEIHMKRCSNKCSRLTGMFNDECSFKKNAFGRSKCEFQCDGINEWLKVFCAHYKPSDKTKR